MRMVVTCNTVTVIGVKCDSDVSYMTVTCVICDSVVSYVTLMRVVTSIGMQHNVHHVTGVKCGSDECQVW